jgi:hypothetical protein
MTAVSTSTLSAMNWGLPGAKILAQAASRPKYQ